MTMSTKQFKRLMNEVTSRNVGQLQEEVSTKQDDVAQRIVKKLKVDHGYMFQKKDMNNNSALMQRSMNISRKHKKRIRLDRCQL